MFDIGFLELVVVGVLGLLVLGPERLPKAAHTVGRMIGRVRRTMTNFQNELERQVRAEELQEKLKNPYATFLDDDDPRNKQQVDHPMNPYYDPATNTPQGHDHSASTTPPAAADSTGKPQESTPKS